MKVVGNDFRRFTSEDAVDCNAATVFKERGKVSVNVLKRSEKSLEIFHVLRLSVFSRIIH